MRLKYILATLIQALSLAVSLAVIITGLDSAFQKTRYRLDTASIVKTHQNIQKLIKTSPIRISESLNAKEEINNTKTVSNNNISKKLKHKKATLETSYIKKNIPSFNLPTSELKTSRKTLPKVIVKLKEKIEITTKDPFELKAITIKKELKVRTKWVASYRPFFYTEVTHKKQKIATTNKKIKKEIIYKTVLPQAPTKITGKQKERNIAKSDYSVKTIISKSHDRISTLLAATEKSNVITNKSSITTSKKQKVSQLFRESKDSSQDDLVFFDYSTSDTVTNSTYSGAIDVVENIPVNKNVENHTGTLVSAKKAKITDDSAKKLVKSSVNNINVDIRKNNQKSEVRNDELERVASHNRAKNLKSTKVVSTQPTIASSIINSFVNSDETKRPVTKRPRIISQGFKSEYSITVKGVTEKSLIQNLKNFEVRFADDQDDIKQDYGAGIIKLEQKINNSLSVRRGVILASSYIPTVVDFVLENSSVASTIPLISRDQLDSYIKKNNINGLGGHVLVELDDLTEDVEIEIERGYQKKIYLNKDFRLVDPTDSEYSQIMFLGVSPGNAILNFRTYKNEYTSKIINVSNDEIYFDSNFYVEIKGEKIDLFEENLLAKDQFPLNIRNSQISNFSFKSKVTKKALNRYEVNRAVYPLGTRKYFELKHLDESIFIGYWDNKEVEVPSESYMRFILDNFNIPSVSSQCLVQLNLRKSAKRLSYEGDNGNSPIRINQLLLDSDGVFYDEFGHSTNKVFLLGEEQGIINIKLEYADGSFDFVQTFCSDSTYLVEQL